MADRQQIQKQSQQSKSNKALKTNSGYGYIEIEFLLQEKQKQDAIQSDTLRYLVESHGRLLNSRIKT